MNTTGFVRYPGAVVALAILAACGGTVGDMPNAPSTAALDYRSLDARLSPSPRYAMIVPDRRAKSKDFEYIINDYGSYATIFDYPKSVKQIGTVNNVGGQGCTNVLYGYGKQTFWIVQSDTEINQYRAPHKLLRALSDSVGMPSSCAMNNAGDLAVGILNGNGSGDVVIYKGASGSGTPMTTTSWTAGCRRSACSTSIG